MAERDQDRAQSAWEFAWRERTRRVCARSADPDDRRAALIELGEQLVLRHQGDIKIAIVAFPERMVRDFKLSGEELARFLARARGPGERAGTLSDLQRLIARTIIQSLLADVCVLAELEGMRLASYVKRECLRAVFLFAIDALNDAVPAPPADQESGEAT